LSNPIERHLLAALAKKQKGKCKETIRFMDYIKSNLEFMLR